MNENIYDLIIDQDKLQELVNKFLQFFLIFSIVIWSITSVITYGMMVWLFAISFEIFVCIPFGLLLHKLIDKFQKE